MSDQSIPVEYRVIPDWPTYRVGTDGSVWTCWRKGPRAVEATARMIETGQQQWKQMRPRIDDDGYRAVELVSLDGKRLHRKVCQLVLRAFVGPPPEGHESRHLNGNEADDSLGNLAWGTPLENHADKRAHGTIATGANHGKVKLTDEQIAAVLARKGSATQQAVADEFGISRGYVGQLWSGARQRVESPEQLSSDPADFDGRLPQCEYCTDNVATKRCKVGGALLCDECYSEWLMGRFDEPAPIP